MVDAISLFRHASARNEGERQRRIWRCFGVDYQKELEKQRRIWEALYNEGKVDSPVPPPPPFQHEVLEDKGKPYVHPNMENEYRSLKQAVLNHLKHRPKFSGEVDLTLIDRLARIWALWLLYEKWTSLAPEDESTQAEGTQAESTRLVDAFYKIDRMLSRALQELNLTPSMRRKIADDLEEDDEVTRKLRKLLQEKQKHQEKKREKKQEAGG